MTRISPFAAGLSGRCPRCGEGAMFSGFLKIAPSCDACGQDFSNADIGDGAAVFVMFIAGFGAVIPALLIDIAYRPPIWVHFAYGIPIILFLSVFLLRPMKGLLFAYQYHHKAEEARFPPGRE
jgi:uncharacterized protein (DUF983 family)